MSLGSWALLAFGAVTFLSFLAALAEAGRLRWRWLPVLRPPRIVGGVIAVVGGLLGFFVAGYTGVLLAVTNRPIWADTSLLGLVFLISAASTSAALLVLLARGRWSWRSGVMALKRFDSMVLVFELLAVIALVVSLGSVARAWLNVWGALLVVGVVLAGIVIPLILKSRPRVLGERWSEPTAAALVLVGGFLLRVIVILSSESAGVIG